MHTLHFMDLPKAERPQETKEFEEPSTGVKLTFTLRAYGAADCARANEVCRALCEDYIDGSADRPAGPFPDPEIKLSRELFRNAATLAEMQVDTQYSALDFVFLSDRAPLIYAQAMEMARSLNATWGRAQGNSPGAPTA